MLGRVDTKYRNVGNPQDYLARGPAATVHETDAPTYVVSTNLANFLRA
jgi:hypothetical protein